MSGDPLETLRDMLKTFLQASRGLLPTVPYTERTYAYQWLAKLWAVESSFDALKNHTEYAWYLLMNLENAVVLSPFDSSPPFMRLQPLRNLLPQEVYNIVLEGVDGRILRVWEEQKEGGVAEENKSADDDFVVELTPRTFFDGLPAPRNGVYCYVCVFGSSDD